MDLHGKRNCPSSIRALLHQKQCRQAELLRNVNDAKMIFQTKDEERKSASQNVLNIMQTAENANASAQSLAADVKKCETAVEIAKENLRVTMAKKAVAVSKAKEV